MPTEYIIIKWFETLQPICQNLLYCFGESNNVIGIFVQWQTNDGWNSAYIFNVRQFNEIYGILKEMA